MVKSRSVAALTAAFVLSAFPGPALAAAVPAPDVSVPTAGRESLADLVAQLSPSVVNVQVVKQARGLVAFEPGPGMPGPRGPLPPGFQDRFPFRTPVPPHGPMPRHQGVGSGFVLSADGYVVTNHHVVDGATDVKVTLLSGDEYEAKVVGRDPKTDLALLKIEPRSKLQAVTLGDSDAMRVGDPVFAIGNPFGLQGTVTSGIISARGRVIGAGPYDDFLQTDTAINPGNSGGPLFNMKGEVVGINTAIVGPGQGLGFAIPANLARTVLAQLRTDGRVTRGWLGVTIQPLTQALARSLELDRAEGALVSEVAPGGPADKGGLKAGDVIVALDGKPVTKSAGLPALVSGIKPGTAAKVDVVRDGKRRTLTVAVGRMPEEEQVAAGAPDGPTGPPRAGVALAPVPPGLASRLGLEAGRGALVTAVQPDGPAARAGVRAGDVVVEVNRKPVAGPGEAAEAIRHAPANESILVRLARNGAYLFAAIEPPAGKQG